LEYEKGEEIVESIRKLLHFVSFGVDHRAQRAEKIGKVLVVYFILSKKGKLQQR
jgi:hypothetical protein